jgi:beta-glucanase (GH16 family)
MMPCNNDFGANPWPKCGEIDIMEEVGVNPNYTSSSLHTEKFNHVMKTQITKERLTAGAEDGFHVYRLEWTPDYIKTYVDGKELLNFNNDGKNDVGSWPFNKPFYVILNLAWGGDWGGMKDVDESALPVRMEVDYVRVFQKK